MFDLSPFLWFRGILLCNVPTLGHHHSADIYDAQSSQMDVMVSIGVFERHCGVHHAFLIIFHHYKPFRKGWLWFRCIPTISMILTILSYKSMKFIEEVILGTLLEEPLGVIAHWNQEEQHYKMGWIEVTFSG